MSRKEILQKAYGTIPKEVGLNFGPWGSSYRGFKYYWLVLVRRFRKLG